MPINVARSITSDRIDFKRKISSSWMSRSASHQDIRPLEGQSFVNLDAYKNHDRNRLNSFACRILTLYRLKLIF